jgi:hypothetical protein
LPMSFGHYLPGSDDLAKASRNVVLKTGEVLCAWHVRANVRRYRRPKPEVRRVPASAACRPSG